MKLYISDLDGTLLNSNQELSRRTANQLNNLINRGLNFSFATARSLDSSKYIMEKLRLKLPVIVHNGVFIYDPIKNENISSSFMDFEKALEILKIYKASNINPFVYTINSKGVRKAYYKSINHYGEKIYINDRLARGDKRFTQVSDFHINSPEYIIAITAIGEEKDLKPLSFKIKENFKMNIHLAEDIYSGATWLEVNHEKANKKEAVKKLKEVLKAEKIICFGDHLNDIPMFEVADEKYAVENAQTALKKIATEVIESNDKDGVISFLEKQYP